MIVNNSYFILILLYFIQSIHPFRVFDIVTNEPVNNSYFLPFQPGFVGITEDASNYVRERVNEGVFPEADQEIIYQGTSPRQSCPGMVGPFSDGSYYCTAKEFGYCDRRSGTCFCNIGYEGIDCFECQITHYRVGNLCYPKKLCPNNCNGAGICNFNNGTCSCFVHRFGESCETELCTRFDDRCTTCTTNECLACAGGYYLTGYLTSSNGTKVCSTCYDFDPRCAGCTKDQGCTVCADSLLTSVRRSGYRSVDPLLPIEENTRELSITLPFGTKSPESFAEAEDYFVVTKSNTNYLKDSTTRCDQGLNNTAAWVCSPYPSSYKVCGHYGVFSFEYPNYQVSENYGYLRLSVKRSGGGYGEVSVYYNIKHITTNDSDVTATAPYTTLQKLVFESGVVEKTFIINILQDTIVEENEVFQVFLETPEGGGSLSPQFRANVTIIDDDLYSFSSKLTHLPINHTTVRAGQSISLNLQAHIAYNSERMTSGGEEFYVIIENDLNQWKLYNQQNSITTRCDNITDYNNGSYLITCPNGIKQQGVYNMHVFHINSDGLLGQYYYDGFFQNLALTRLDKQIDFNWGLGRLIPRGSDYISIRWSGLLFTPLSQYYIFKLYADDNVRLWINNELIIDHFNERASNLELYSSIIYLYENTFNEIVVEYREVDGIAYSYLYWNNVTIDISNNYLSNILSNSSLMIIIPSKYLYSIEEIDRSPIELTVLSNKTSASNTECNGDGLVGGLTNQPNYFSTCPRDIYNNLRNDDDYYFLTSQDFTVYLTYLSIDDQMMLYNGEGSEFIEPLLIYNNLTSCFDSYYIPQLAGNYRLDIIYGINKYSYISNYRTKNSSNYLRNYISNGIPKYLPDYLTVFDSVYLSNDNYSINDIFHVAGSPFYVTINPSTTFAPYSTIYGLPRPLQLTAGECFNFTIQARDKTRNFRYIGGDNFQVFTLQLEGYTGTPGQQLPEDFFKSSNHPTTSPTITSISNRKRDFQNLTSSANYPIISYGNVVDLYTGRYTATVCPKLVGIFDLYVQLVSQSYSFDSNYQTNGQDVSFSPSRLYVNHSLIPSANYSFAFGKGLSIAIVGISNSFIITIYDIYNNIYRDSFVISNLRLYLNNQSMGIFNYYDYYNGSYLIEYIPHLSDYNNLSIRINDLDIYDSPYFLYIYPGITSSNYSYAVGKGLVSGIVNEVSYFYIYSYDLYNNPKTNQLDRYIYHLIDKHNNLTIGEIYSCINDSISSNPCYDNNTILGHYIGSYRPYYSGEYNLSVYLLDNQSDSYIQISNSPFHPVIIPNIAIASNTDVSGNIYRNIAGEIGYIDIQLRDINRNKLIKGSDKLEIYLTNNQNVSLTGDIIDNQDGSYIVNYNITKSGNYQLSISLAEPGLVVYTYNTTNYRYNDTNYAIDSTFYESTYIQSISTNVNLTDTIRQEYFSVRFTGLIIPDYLEITKFIIRSDSQSLVNLYIKPYQPGDSVSQISSDPLENGYELISNNMLYLFTTYQPYNIIVDYIHYQSNDISIQLLWECLSSPLSIIRNRSFKHWQRIQNYNLTIYPNKLCSTCSTAYSSKYTISGLLTDIYVDSRDSFNNILLAGDQTPRLLGINSQGIAFRGDVYDYQNGSYLITYYPTKIGRYILYLTIGCCAPKVNLGLIHEITQLSSLLISDSPSSLIIYPNEFNTTTSVITNKGLVSSIAGVPNYITIYPRDLYNNPTNRYNKTLISIEFYLTIESDYYIVTPDSLSINTDSYIESMIDTEVDKFRYVTITYNITKAGSYVVVLLYNKEIISTTINLTILPNQPNYKNIQLSTYPIVNQLTNNKNSFELLFYDLYKNHITNRFPNLYIRIINYYIYLPKCVINKLNRYICTYTTTTPGLYNLIVKLIDSTNGVSISYYSNDIYINSTIIPYMLLDIPNSYIHTFIDRYINQISVKLLDIFSSTYVHSYSDSSIDRYIDRFILTTYLVIPKSTSYKFKIVSSNINSSLYIDDQLVYDSTINQSTSYIYYNENTAVFIKIFGYLDSYQDSYLPNYPVYLSLLWTTIELDESYSIIPYIYLYYNVKDIHDSPFPFNVTDI